MGLLLSGLAPPVKTWIWFYAVLMLGWIIAVVVIVSTLRKVEQARTSMAEEPTNTRGYEAR